MPSKIILIFILVYAMTMGNCQKNNPPAATRYFYMGVTPWPADFTNAELDTAYDFINNHCDIVSHHFDDGIPYDEAYHAQPMPAVLSQEVSVRKSKTAAGKKILLSVAALNLSRTQKADYYTKETISDSIKNEWQGMAVNDPRVINAYMNYISYLIDQLNPSFVNYGVESNSLAWDSAGFSQYKDFLSQVYPLLKQKYPGIPFFLSFMVDESTQGFTNATELLPYTAYVGLSAYPYVSISSSVSGNTDPALFPSGYFERYITMGQGKPFLFAETGYIAKNLSIPAYQLNKQGTPAWQNAYLQKVCSLSNTYQAKMLIWYCSKDYDAGDATLRSLGLYSDVWGIWQDIGLKDSSGAARPSCQTWLDWMAMKKN